MYNTGDYISLIDRGVDYLDKPHFLFWTAAASYILFGVSAFSFKLTSLLFGCLTLYSTFRLAEFFYSRKVATYAVLILATFYSFALSLNDVRMDAILTGAIAFSTWQLILLYHDRKYIHVLLSALGLAIGFSTKGLIAFVIPVIALSVFIVQQKSWLTIFSTQYVLTGVTTLLFILPVLYCFYVQFDLHPEKVIHGSSGNSGVNFILFGQTTQRLLGQGKEMPGGPDPFFYLHTSLWALLPWSLLTIGAWTQKLMILLKKRTISETGELVCFITPTISLVLLSIVSSKLPHYLNFTLPFFAILTASFISSLSGKLALKLRIMQQILGGLLILLAFLLMGFIFELPIFYKTGCLLAIVAAGSFVLLRVEKNEQFRTMLVTIAPMTILIAVLNFHFFPRLMDHQAGQGLGQKVLRDRISTDAIFFLDGYEMCNDFDFYLNVNIPSLKISGVLNAQKPYYIITGKNGLAHLRKENVNVEILEEVNDFKVSKISLRFLNPTTRNAALTKMYLIKVSLVEDEH
jgi:4-amino-4-deoxy-L-arabinose transferase-like glycosyltransferase